MRQSGKWRRITSTWYPPGIPLIVPGEVITEEFIRHIRECRERKLNVEGQGNLAPGRIKIVYF